MRAFEFDHHVISSYERFSRSFSSIRSEDLRAAIDAQYDAGRFWPDALLSLNPRYLSGPSVDDLVASGDLDDGTGKVFRFGEKPLRLHRHQAESIAKAKSGKSFVVTTGTGSGKSLCFFVPVVDAIIRSLRAGKPRTTRAIIVYPMNALANSQMKEIDKFIGQSGLPDALKPVVKRYTGQESQEERQRIAANPPDILLTNYMMAELLLTRQDDLDAQVIKNATGLEFIILDELHTYRGRQGADVAVLVRRLRDRCSPDKAPICIGTSATMASEGTEESRAVAVAKVATRLFGSEIGPDAVIDESLQRATDDTITLAQATAALADVVRKPLPASLDDEQLRKHPLAVWAELALGLDDGLELKRKKPIPFEDAVKRLAEDTGFDAEHCRKQLEGFLTLVSLPEDQRGGTGDGAFLAFKLHRFISGAGEIFTTLTDKPRTVLFEGQLEDPDAPGNRLYPTRFCRNCGHEYHVVTKNEDDGHIRFLPRNIDDTPLETEDDNDVAGYLCPAPANDPDFAFDGELSGYPESWLEERNGIERLRSYRKKRAPISYVVTPDGRHGAGGKEFWFIPGKFAFCLCCKDEPNQGMRERSKLAGLSGEGRSSATTLLVSSALEWMNKLTSGVPKTKRKLLGFTDNRQDAALQSGHFNDFLFVSLLRGAILRAIIAAGPEGLTEDEFGLSVVKALGFTSANKEARAHWMLDPSAGAVIREDAQRALAKVLAHRVWTDLRRGWRYTNPSLSVLKLLDVDFVGVADMAADRERLMTVLPELGDQSEEQRAILLETVLGAMLEGLAVNTEALDLTVLDGVAQKSRSLLRAPWAIDAKENPRGRSSLLLRAPGKNAVGLREEQTLLRAGHNSRIARLINKKSVLGAKLGRDDYLEFFSRLLELFADEGLIVPVELDADLVGWRLTPSAVRLVPGPALSDESKRGNRYFHDLYASIADDLASGHSAYWGLEGREHTAQVSQRQREWREWRFRYEDDDLENLSTSEYRTEIKTTGESDQFLPALFCSPTMELGVDISALNAVYLRNVPPTPANYAQRAGRSGRSGQAAVVVTYCASGSPHDQYFFERRNDMVAGVVRPPALDITNEELVRSHLHAVWLAERLLCWHFNTPTRRFIVGLFKETFGFHDLAPAAAPLAMIASGRVPMVVVPPSETLDRRSPTLSVDRSRSPAFALRGGVGDVNTYAVFTDHFWQLTKATGYAGLIIPTGLVSGFTYRAFLGELLSTKSLVAFYGFENEDLIFPHITNKVKFGLLTMAGRAVGIEQPWFTAHIRQPSEIADPEKRYSLTVDEIRAINPNTLNLPAFRWSRDAKVTAAIHMAAPILIEKDGNTVTANPWQVSMSTLFHMSGDSEHFLDHNDVASQIKAREGALAKLKDGRRVFPLYEGKMYWNFDHRYGTYEGQTENQANKGVLPRVTKELHDDPDYRIEPRYWVEEALTNTKLADEAERSWFFSWRDVGISERTLIGTIIPKTAAGHVAPVMFSKLEQSRFALLCTALGTLVVDYAIRQKTMRLSFFVLEQAPILAPSSFDNELPWLGATPANWLSPRVLELCYTNVELTQFARDLGFEGAPFTWSEDRRPTLQAEIDAAMLHFYGLNREQSEWVLNSFTVLRKYEERDHNEFRTKRLVLTAYDAMAAAKASGTAYQTPMFPPPADISLCHSADVSKYAQVQRPIEVTPLEQLPDAAWARAVPSPQHDPSAALAAILKSLDGPTPIRTIRLIAAIMLEPHLLTPILSPEDQTQWRRLVGQEAEPRSGNVLGFSGRTTPGWNAAITNHRGNGRLLEDIAVRTWTPGTGLEAFDTSGWPEGRARFVLDALRNLDIDATVNAAPAEVRDWIANAAAG